MKWNKDTKEKINYGLAAIMLVFGITMTIAGFIVPPLGEISATVLTLFGEALTFAGALLGISLHYENELTQFKNQVNQRLSKKDLEDSE